MQEEVARSRALAAKCPRELVVGIAKDPQGKYNPIALGWMMNTSHRPAMMAVSIGKTRYSLQAFRHAGEFVIAFPSERQRDETMRYGTQSGRDTDKLAAAGAKIEPARKIHKSIDYRENLLGETGKPVGDDFEYNSLNNPHYLEASEIDRLCQTT